MSRVHICAAVCVCVSTVLYGGWSSLPRSVISRASSHSKSSVCAPQCAKPTSAGCEKLQDVPVASARCLLVEADSNLTENILETVLGSQKDGRCDVSSEGGCSATLAYEVGLRDWGLDWPPRGFSMIGRARLLNLKGAIEAVNREEIAGNIVELGVWRGGAMMLASAVNIESDFKRDIYLFDAFASLQDYETASGFLAVSEEDVRRAFSDFGLLNEHIYFVKGLFTKTLPTWDKSNHIAVLRVDSNFYDSYQDAMYYLFDQVSVGGIVIFDDILSHQPVMDLWEDFKKDQQLDIELVQIDFHSAWFRKLKPSNTDWRYFRAPRDANIHINPNQRHSCPIEIEVRSGGHCHSSWGTSVEV